MREKLDVFSYIDTACAVLDSKREGYGKSAARISAYLEKAFENVDSLVGVTYRIKATPSLKEKIIRNNLYKQYSAEELVSACSDIAGIRLECRFLDDEKALFERLEELFCNEDENGYYYPDGHKHLMLKLGSPQPERQKNGLEIYRIDGYVILGGERYNYELQIKSLVNSFWSEIEHKIIYKNKRFMLIDGFVNELMSSINENLKNIDRQLNMLFHHCLDTSQSGQTAAIGNMLLGLINEVFSRLVENKVGVSVNIKPYSQALVKYILEYSSFALRRDDKAYEGFGKERSPFGQTVVHFMEWMRSVKLNEIPVGSPITFGRPFVYENEMQEIIGKKFIAEINRDFFCNTFFHILFSLEVGNDMQDFSSYLRYYTHRIGAEQKSETGKVRLKYEIEKADPGKLVLESEIERLCAIE